MTGHERVGNEVDLKAIDVVRSAHVAALNAGDAQAWTTQFTDDAVQMPPNAPANVGGSKIASWSQAFLDQFRVHFALAVDEVRVLGEWAFERGGYTISLTSKAGGPPMEDMGKYGRFTSENLGKLGEWPATFGTAIHRLPPRSLPLW
jgi:uncharacterized protein (TIGR02246 family)